MPITFSVTCDTDAELARFLENLSFGNELHQAAPTPAKTAKQKESSETKAAVAVPRKSVKTAPKSTAVKVAKPAQKQAKSKMLKVAAKPGRKPGELSPIISASIQEMKKKGKPFRSREVIDLVLKKSPHLKASSVTTGVSKMLSESPLKWQEIKDTVGRPYKLYKP
jgi:hypothetical protein